MNDERNPPPMKPVDPDQVRQPSKPWWVLADSRTYALFLAIFDLVFGCFWAALGIVQERWWNAATGASWLILDVAAWATVRWHRQQPSSARAPSDDGKDVS